MKLVHLAADVSGLQQLGQLFSALFQVWLPIALLLALAGYFLVIVGRKFNLMPFMLLMLMAAPLAGMFAPFATSPAEAADGSNGTIEAGVTQVTFETPVHFLCSDLDTSSDYGIWLEDSSLFNFTTSASNDQWTFVYSFSTSDDSGSDGILNVTLASQSDGGVIDQVNLKIDEVDTYIPDDAIIEVAITLLVIAIIVGLLAYVAAKF